MGAQTFEERFAYRIAKAIVHDRQTQPYTRTKALADDARVVPKKNSTNTCDTQFQAIRIFINQELDELNKLCPTAFLCLRLLGV